MTRDEAANEAIKRWGRGGTPFIADRHWRLDDLNQRFLVSNCKDECGVGPTWEAAFAAADKHKAAREEKA